MFQFRLIAMIFAAFCIALSVLWFVSAGAYMETYGVLLGEGGDIFGRRMAPVVLGLGVLMYLARDEPPSSLRRALCICVAIIFGGVALTGIMAYFTGVASFAILVAAATEILAAMVILTVAQAD